MSKNQNVSKLFWIDLEMTGLDVEKEVIIEVAAIITDIHFNILETYHSVVNQEQKYLDAMDGWNMKHHTDSGLVAKIPGAPSPAKVEKDLIQLVDKHFQKEPAVLSGNSIAQDRLFINKYFKEFSYRLHYRMLDVTSWKILMKSRFNIVFEKKNSHRAQDDIMESIREMKTYLSHVRVDS